MNYDYNFTKYNFKLILQITYQQNNVFLTNVAFFVAN